MVGKSQMPASVSQKKPYDVKASVPKVLFFLHSMTPAMIWATPAVEDAHGQDHGVELEEAGVVDVEKDGGEAEPHEPQRGRVGVGVEQLGDCLV